MKYLPPPCKGGCGRGVRPRRSNKEDYPYNTKLEKGGGFCGKCYVPHRIPKPWQKPCAGCEYDMRPNGSDRREYPGTREHHARGFCTACRDSKRRGRDGKPRVQTPIECVRCERKLRPRHRSEDDYPGTKEHAGKGLCRSCEDAVRKGRVDFESLPAPRYEEATIREHVVVEVTDPALLRFEAERKARLEKAERLRQVRIAQEQARARFIASRRKVAA